MAEDRLFVVRRRYGSTYQPDRPLEQQPLWREHADFIDRLTEQGIVRLAGPLVDTGEAMLVVQADSAEDAARRMALDPWTSNGVLETVQIAEWALRIGEVEKARV